MNSDLPADLPFLYRCGFPNDGRPNIGITHLSLDRQMSNDPYFWGDRTWANAHNYIIDHWHKLETGSVVDVRVILGEAEQPAKAEIVA